MTKAADTADRIVSHLLGLPRPESRCLVALAGPPAVGKSTVAEQVVQGLNKAGRPAGLLAMDGFHLDNTELEARGLLHRKGAPETFDLTGFAATIARLKADPDVPVPIFDRAADRAISGAATITADQSIVVIEGNYLLLDEPGWRALAQQWDVSVFLDEGLDELETRLVARWLDHGLDAASARQRARSNDLPNAARLLAARLPASLTL